jgi:hypothetical protein
LNSHNIRERLNHRAGSKRDQKRNTDSNYCNEALHIIFHDVLLQNLRVDFDWSSTEATSQNGGVLARRKSDDEQPSGKREHYFPGPVYTSNYVSISPFGLA